MPRGNVRVWMTDADTGGDEHLAGLQLATLKQEAAGLQS